MCGLVGFAQATFASHQMKELFKQMLYVDTLRGHHATGVAAIDSLNNKSDIHKRALPGPAFLADPATDDKLFHYRHNYNIYIGHNRWATAGKADDDNNAHPFEHGHIIGAHNGSIRDRTLLEDHTSFAVDSDNVFYHMALNGLADTIKKLDGAFVLTWYDKDEKTLNFIRNDERPLTFARTSEGVIWASERMMLEWMVRRHKNIKFLKLKGPEEGAIEEDAIFDLPEYTHLSVPFDGRAFGIPKLKTYQKPTFTKRSAVTMGWGGMDRDDDWDAYDAWQDRAANDYANRRKPERPAVLESRQGESKYQQTAREACAKFLPEPNGIGTWVELEFIGSVKERSNTGFECSLSLFKFQSFLPDHKIIRIHSFNHNSCYTREWTEADEGKRVYGRISGVIAHHAGTYNATRNEDLGVSISVESITEVRPPAIFGSFHLKSDSDVIPFDGGTPAKKRGGAAKQKVSKGRRKNSKRGADKSLLEPGVSKDFCFRFASGESVDIENYIRISDANSAMCQSCANNLKKKMVSQIYYFPWYRLEDGESFEFITCSKECHEDLVNQCDHENDVYEEGRARAQGK